MEFVLFQFLITMTMICIVNGQCIDFTVTNSSGHPMNSSLACQNIYNTTYCLEFFRTFNKTYLPDEFQTDGTVDKPYDIELDGLSSPWDEYMYPGLSISWRAPFSETSYNNCIGYLMVWFTDDEEEPDRTRCRLFSIMKGTQAKFQNIVERVADNATYTVRVYSMPPYSLQNKDNEMTFVQKRIKTGGIYQKTSPDKWYPYVMYETFNNGTISMSFSLPPVEFNMTYFSVQLMSIKDINFWVEQKNCTTELRSETVTKHYVFFTVREPGTYYLVVYVEDEFHLVPGKCRCWETMNNGRVCANVCGSIRTENFYVNITEPPKAIQTIQPTSKTTAETIMTTQPTISTASIYFTTQSDPFQTTTTPTDHTVMNVLIGVFSALALIIIITLLIICILRRNERVKQYVSKLWPSVAEPNPIYQGKEEVIQLKRKTVYFMSASDHAAHNALVQSIVVFLQEHCFCDVIIPSDSDERENGPFKWFLSNIMKCNYIIFLNSEGAQKMIEAFINKSVYKNRTNTEVELFNIGLNHIMLNPDVREQQIFLISFNGTHCQKYLQVPETYMLPMQLPRLLQKMHGINSIKNYSSVLPLIADNISNLHNGAKMLSAKKNVEIYERKNPNWLQESFGELKNPDSGLKSSLPCDLKPLLTTSTSIDSGNVSNESGCSDSVSRQFNQGPDTPIQDHDLDAENFSVITINTYGITSPGKFTQNNKIKPPTTLSNIHSENFSEAVFQINKNNNPELPRPTQPQIFLDNHVNHPKKIMENHVNSRQHLVSIDDNFQAAVVPPDSLSDVNIDSLSSALADINYNSGFIALQGLQNFLMLQNDDQGYLQQDSDSESI